MNKFHVQGPTKLQDEVTISDAKNTAPSILFAALPAEEPVEIQNVPKLEDVDTSMRLLSQLGTKIECNGSVYIDTRDVNVFYVPYDLVKTVRASIWALGSLVARFGQGQVSPSGGRTIGARPVDLHISGLEQLDATIKLKGGYVKAFAGGRLKGARIVMDKVSVDAAVTIMCAVTLVEDTMIIENVTREPEIVDTANSLITLGAEVNSQGTNHIVIEGVKRLGDGVYRVLPDRIETGTLLAAATISRGKIICRNTQPDTLDAVLVKLRDAEADIEVGEDWVSLDMHGKRPKAVNVRTAPHPAFPTDMQAQSTLLNLVAEGIGFITETVFENRFVCMSELGRMGTHAGIESNTVIYHGVEKLSGVQIMAIDLYAPANLVLAGCIAEGTMMADRIHHVDRGYERIEDKPRALGVNVRRVKDE